MSKKSGAYSFSWLSKKHGLTEEEVIDMDVRYKLADLDRSGQLDRAELKSLLKATIASKMQDSHLDTYLTAQWHNVDKDNSGSVDFDEFLALYAILKLEARRGTKRPAAAVKGASSAGAATASTSGAATGATGTSSGDKKASSKGAQSAATKAKNLSAVDRKKANKDRRKGKKTTKRQKTFTPTGDITQPNFTSSSIVWSTVARNNSFMVKRGGVLFTREPGNLRNLHGFRNSGLANVKNVHITPKGKGNQITLRLRNERKRRQTQPRNAYATTIYNQPQRVLARQFRARLLSYGRPEMIGPALARITRVMEVKGRVAKRTARTKAKREANATKKQ